MISEKKLLENIVNIKIQNGTEVTFETVKNRVLELAKQRLLPVEFKNDQVSKGMLGTTLEDCIVAYHPQHENNFFYYVIRVSHQGVYAFVTIDMSGYSVNGMNKTAREVNKSIAGDIFKGRKSVAENVGQVAGAAIGSMFRMGKNMIKNAQSGGKSNIEEESQWYAMMEDLFNEIFN